MARIITAGNETGDWAGDGFTVYRGSPGTTANQRYPAPSPYNNKGHYSFYLTVDQGLEYDVTDQVPGGIEECWLRLNINPGGRVDGQFERFQLATLGGDRILAFDTLGELGSGTTNGWWSPVIRNSAGSNIASNSTFTCRGSDWAMVEMHVKLSTSSDGIIDVWIGREKVIEYRGQVAGPGLEDRMGFFRLHYDQIVGGSTQQSYYDDVALNDVTGTHNNGRVGVGYVLPFWPAGEGSTSQLTNSFNNSVDNFKFVNKPAADNPSGFVGTSTPDDKDTYVLPGVPDEFSGINAVRVAAFGVRSGPTTTKAKMLLQPPAQAEIDLPSGPGMGIDLPIGAPGYLFQDFNENSNTSAPFQKDEMDGMEAGIQFIA